MIEVTIPYDRDHMEIMSWCEANIGRKARHKSHVGVTCPWYPSARFAHTVFVFAREQDAFLFKLRWL